MPLKSRQLDEDGLHAMYYTYLAYSQSRLKSV